MRLKSSGVVVLITLAMVALLGWVAWGPVRTVDNIQEAMRTGDTAKLTQNIDFPQLRMNVKARLSKALARSAQVDGTEVGLGVELLGSALLGTMVDTLVSPEWLVGAALSARQTQISREQVEQRLEGERSLSFKSPSIAHVSYGDKDGRIILIMNRRGLDWVLIDVDLDLAEETTSANP